MFKFCVKFFLVGIAVGLSCYLFTFILPDGYALVLLPAWLGALFMAVDFPVKMPDLFVLVGISICANGISRDANEYGLFTDG